MNVRNVVPVAAVKDLGRTREFYTRLFNFEVVHQNDWYLHLRAGGDGKLEIGFVASHHHSQPALFQPTFQGEGVFYSIEVEDVDREYESAKREGIPIALDKRDEPWGERHFAIRDPNGIVLNISHTDPSARGKVEYREHMLAKERGAAVE